MRRYAVIAITDSLENVSKEKEMGEVGEIERRTRVIAVGNQKGGVGKTTNTVHIARALTELGRKVLNRAKHVRIIVDRLYYGFRHDLRLKRFSDRRIVMKLRGLSLAPERGFPRHTLGQSELRSQKKRSSPARRYACR